MADESCLSVLVVDDDDMVRTATAMALRSAGLSVIEAATCAAAFALADARRPDVVLLDVRLNGESGLDVLPMLAQAGLAMPVVLLTGQATLEEARLGGERGVCAVLEKPASAEAVVRTLRGAVATHGDPLNRLIRELADDTVAPQGVHGAVVRTAAAPGTDLIAFRQCARAIDRDRGGTAPEIGRVRAVLSDAGRMRRELPQSLLNVLAGLAASVTARGGVRGFQISVQERRDLHRLTGDHHLTWRRLARTQAGLRLVLTTREHVGQISLALGCPHENELARDLRALLGLGPRALREVLGAS